PRHARLCRRTMSPKPNRREPLRLEIEPVVAVAEGLAQRVRSELPTHDGLAKAASGVAAAAEQAERVSRSINRLFTVHKLPAFFLAAALVCLALWIYWRFFHVATLTIAVPDRDARLLRDAVDGDRIDFRRVVVDGSR